VKYTVEMFCDRVAACRTYRGDKYTDADAYNYYMNSKKHYMIHPKTAELLESMLRMLRDRGEDETLRYIKKEILKK
jgi:predicted RNA-binding protein